MSLDIILYQKIPCFYLTSYIYDKFNQLIFTNE
jgi:hypothetical protein